MKKEYLFVAIIAVVFIVINNLPLVIFSSNQTWTSLGTRILTRQSTYPNVSYVEQSAQGNNFFENLYATEPQTSFFAYPSYLLTGKIARLFNIQSITAYNAARIVLSFCFIFVLYKFISLYLKTSNQKLIALIILLTSSGFGFILQALLPNSSDLWMAQSNTFLTLADSPHLIFSQQLLVAAFYFFIQYIKTKRIKYCIGTLLPLSVLLFEDLFLVVVALCSFAMVTLIANSTLWKRFLIILLPLSLIAFLYIVSGRSLIGSEVHTDLLSPTPINYVSGFGLLLIFAAIGGELVLQEDSFPGKLLLSWIGVAFVLAYIPFTFQGQFIQGVHIPLVILTTISLYELIHYLKQYLHVPKKIIRNTVLFIFIVITSLSSMYMLQNDITAIGKDSKSSYYYNLLDPEATGINWLTSHTTKNDVILANEFYGNLIPGMTGRRVFLGSPELTIDLQNKISQVNTFLLDDNELQAYGFLKRHHISYIFLGVNDSIMRFGFRPKTKSYLHLVYFQDGVSIYKVLPITHFLIRPAITIPSHPKTVPTIPFRIR